MRTSAARGGTTRRCAFLISVVASLAALPAASAQSVDRVQVGRPGSATVGFPRNTFVTVAVLPQYTAVGRFDGVSRIWRGPDFRTASGVSGEAALGWRVTFGGASSAAAMARASFSDRSWPVVERRSLRVPHLVGRRNVGTIPAVGLVAEAAGDNDARLESVVAFPLCRGVFAAARFSLTSPAAQYGTAPSDPVLVRGVPARTWNRERARETFGQVALRGHLPVGRVTARSSGRTITGRVRDCRGHAMPGVEVRLLRGNSIVGRVRAGADGRYRFVAPGPGSYRITATLRLTRSR